MKRNVYTLAFLLLLLLLVAGCGDTRPVPIVSPDEATATNVAGSVSTVVVAPTQAAGLGPTITITMATEPTATAVSIRTVPVPAPTDTALAPSPGAAMLTDQLVIDALKAAGLPIGAIVIYTAETDPNKLLGRPNQYIAKATWHDTRLPAPANPAEPEVSDGGGIEIYTDNAGAQRRADYIQNIGKNMPMLVEYDYVHGPILVRLSKELTPAQAEEYKSALEAIPLP